MKIAQPRITAVIAALLGEERRVAESASGRQPRVDRGQAVGDEFGGEVIEVKRQLAIELVLERLSPPERADTLADDAKQAGQ
jgi:hypothetical protein